MSFGNVLGDLVAACCINSASDTLANRSQRIASLSTTVATKKWRVTLSDIAASDSNSIQPHVCMLTDSGGARYAAIQYVSAGVYDVEVLDFTGAQAAGSTLIYIAWFRTAANN